MDQDIVLKKLEALKNGEQRQRLLSSQEPDSDEMDDNEESIPYKYIWNNKQHEINVKVTVKGGHHKDSLLTFHDIGMTHSTQFSTLMNCELFETLRRRFNIVHIDAPGLKQNSPNVEKGCYPTMEQLAEMIPYIVQHFKLQNIFLLGCGIGSNILLRYALNDSSKVEGCIFVNPVISQQDWADYFTTKIFGHGAVVDYLNRYHFENDTNTEDCLDVRNSHQQEFKKFHALNMNEFIDSVNRRTAIPVQRTPVGRSELTIPSLIFVGDSSPFVTEAEELNSRLDPKLTTLCKFQDAGSALLEQQPMKVAQAILLFLKGLGFFPALSVVKIHNQQVRSRHNSERSTNSRTHSRHNSERSTNSDHGDPMAV